MFSNLHDEVGLRELDEEEINNINGYLNNIINIGITNPENKEEILNNIKSIWELQPFLYGNTRTLIGYLKVLNDAFLLGMNIDVDKEIISGPQMFNINNFVNPKRLTKKI